MIKYTQTRDSIVVIMPDGATHTVQRGAVNFEKLAHALLNGDDSAVPGLLTVAKTIESWAQGDFTVIDDHIAYKGVALPRELNQRIVAMVGAGDDPSAMFNFWERLQRNPSWMSVNQLFGFLEHQGIPICPDGKFLTYKGVTNEFQDVHTRKVDNSPGVTNRMARNRISDDPSKPCHFGFHVGALKYANTFGGSNNRVVICEVDPEHVVCVPNDSSQMKMRVCEYTVIGLYGSRLPDTVLDEKPVVKMQAPTDAPTEAEGTKPIKMKTATQVPIRDTQWDEFNFMDSFQLMEQSIGALRKYARHSLLIIGASKMPGGKRTLVTTITKVRPAPLKR